ncbi:hypothetical protein FVE85_0611 [Porphyridium purpureum]|uniref:Aminoglycoside phosphotransferase domain-containing protein n=1 Tax=Porphyridium purpureum TaxID=35688 RepID=A0A5J4Z170_PORPP|nr:hypothetical protein FVE85_0611 [Porphyridium purpureum]|eukprot:POR5631..scf208_2
MRLELEERFVERNASRWKQRELEALGCALMTGFSIDGSLRSQSSLNVYRSDSALHSQPSLRYTDSITRKKSTPLDYLLVVEDKSEADGAKGLDLSHGLFRSDGTPVPSFKLLDFNDELFLEVARGLGGMLVSYEESARKVDASAGILHKIGQVVDPSEMDAPFQGMKRFDVTYENEHCEYICKSVVVKVKQGDQQALEDTVADIFRGKDEAFSNLPPIDYWTKGVLARDIYVFRDFQDVGEFWRIAPEIYYAHADPARGHHVIAMEDIASQAVSEKLSLEPGEFSTMSELKVIIRDISRFHAVHMGQTDSLRDRYANADKWLLAHDIQFKDARSFESIRVVHKRNVERYADAYSGPFGRIVDKLVENMPELIDEINRLAREHKLETVIHGDFSTRNCCLRAGGERALVYDWELMAIGIPCIDITELLYFGLHPRDATRETFFELARFSHACLVESVAAVGNPVAVCDFETYLHAFCLTWLRHCVLRTALFVYFQAGETLDCVVELAVEVTKQFVQVALATLPESCPIRTKLG